jgi:predicted nucleic acid-binding protein
MRKAVFFVNRPKYVLDTNVFISLQRLYPSDIFSGLWKRIEELFENGTAISSDEVFEEIQKGSDELVAWAEKRKEYFYPSDESIQLKVKDILSKYGAMVTSAKKPNAADPFVVALAAQMGCTLVTDEKRSGNERMPKIPNVCDAYGVRCVNFFSFLRELKIKL